MSRIAKARAALAALTPAERQRLWLETHGREPRNVACEYARASIRYDRLIINGLSPIEALHEARLRLPEENWEVFDRFIKNPRTHGRAAAEKRKLLALHSLHDECSPDHLASD